ncbi:MAG: hypothetical protein ABIR62_06590, partial [Dokdonella sp.]|uniref:hypothetical protein n=1 Tax=Dokdonella sp. TaxID=2291710 RepID=UPI003265706F
MNRPLLIACLAALTAGPIMLLPASASPTPTTVHAQGAKSVQGSPLEVTITLAPFTGNPNTCGTAASLEVNVGDQVNVCYTLTNHGSTALAFQSLTDSLDGPLLRFAPIAIGAGQSHPYVRTIVATGDTDRSASWTGYANLASYTADSTVTPNFIDISTTGTDLGFAAGDGFDNEVAQYTADFPLRFYGRTATALCISNDGLLQYDDATCIPPQGQEPPPGFSFNQDIPSTYGTEVPTYLAPMWMNIGDGPGGVYAKAIGTAPNRQFIVQWSNLYSYAIATTGVSFEVVFNESNDTIRYEYGPTLFGNTADNGAWSTVGLQADPNGLYTKYSYYQPSLSSNSAIQWNYTPSISATADSGTVHISAGLPTLVVPTASVDAIVAPGESATGTLTIGNTGNRDLHWNLSQAPGGTDAHFPKVPRYVKPATNQPIDRTLRLPRTGIARPNHPAYALAPPSNHPRATVPAYGVSVLMPGLVGFDALDPTGSYTPINDSSDLIDAGAFIGNDFTKLYVIVYDSWELPPGAYGTIDVATGAFTQLGMISGGLYPYWRDLTQDPLTGTVYVVNYDDSGLANAAAALYTVDLSTGHATRIGLIDGPGVHPIHYIAGLAVSPGGLMYGIDLFGKQLLAIDKSSGAASVIDSLGLNVRFVQDIEFDEQSGTLYWAALYIDPATNQPKGEMRTIDPLTAISQPLGLLPPAGEYPIDELTALAIATPSVGCAAPGSVPWLSFGTASGTIVAGGADQSVTVTFDSTGLSPGLHRATICVFSDDPRHPSMAVPVAFAVSDPSLYDQNVVDSALLAFNNTIVTPPGTGGLSSEGADDFVIEGPTGWAVTSFTFSAYGNAGNPLPAQINLAIHNDDGSGHPGATVVCEASNLGAIPIPASHQVGVWLPATCTLAPGTWWVVWSFANVNIASPILGFWGETATQHNQPAVWRNPGGALSPTCT